MTTKPPRDDEENPLRDQKPDEALAFEPVGEAKRLLRTIRSGALATLNEAGAPFATLTQLATHYDGSPILLMSLLAAHTRQLERDPRCSLLLAQGGRGDPLAHPRLTLEGRAARATDRAARERFLRRNPKASLYADFADFSFWRLEIEGVHVNGGFARAADLRPEELLTGIDGAKALIENEAAVLAGLNKDQADTLRVLAANANGAWRASGLDPEGIDLVSGDAVERIVFGRPVATPEDLRAHLAELLAAAQKGA